MSRQERIVSPWRTLLSLGLIGAGCALLMYLIPDDGIALTEDKRLVFASFDDLLPSQHDGIIDAEEFLKSYMPLLDSDAYDLDSLIDRSIDPDSARKGHYILVDGAYVLDPQLEEFKERMRVQSGSAGIKGLPRFFERARALNNHGGKLRILHYGDSQIEADRISRYLRNEFQKRFGGAGPGLVPPVEIVPTGAIRQSAGTQWKRYTIFGKTDTSITHQRYAPLGSFASYDSSFGELTFGPSSMAYGTAAKYELVHLLYGNYASEATLEVYLDDSLFSKHNLPADSAQRTLTWEISPASGPFTLRFSGGPIECYAIGFEGYSGLQVDNIPMRGSSGTIFRKIERRQLAQRLTELNAGLVLLQYGGNSVPYVKDSVAAENYGVWMRSQIRLLQEILPEAAFILIGPSDMAYKEKDQFVTYPMLEKVRDELKLAAFDTGCGYWDIYEVMGGRNSMSAWVNSDPPLAGPDYIHFTPKGARRVAELLVKALLDAEKELQNDL